MSISRVSVLASVGLWLAACNYLTDYHPPVTASAAATSTTAAKYTLHTWKKIQLNNQFWSEGATFADFNRDGKMDVVSGPYWWEGPDFTKRHTIYADTRTFKLKKDDGTEEIIPGFEGVLGKNNTYSDNFFAFTYDFNGDGWPDVLIYGFPGADASWFENPGKAGINGNEPWKRHVVFDVVDNESPTWGDLLGTGKPVIICMSDGFAGYVAPNWEKPTEKWIFHKISPKVGYGRFTHGLGFGDVNSDGRRDILEGNGWYEQPASLAGDPEWKFHPFKFNGGGAQMYAYDVNGDGLTDVITSLAAHGYGLVWWEQLKERDAAGEIQFKQHVIMNTKPEDNRYGVKFSQLHAVELVDMDGDGLKDIVTGKRFWAHGSHGDADPDAPAVLYWFKLVRGKDKSVDWVPHLIDDNSGVGTQVVVGDLNGDKLPDVVVGNKKGTFVHLHSTKVVSKDEWEKAQPPVKFADAGSQVIKASEVVVRTGTPPANPPSAGGDVKSNPPLPGNGVLPIGKDGKPLNTDFETGTLKDWTAKGAAFEKQPILGDTVVKRRAPMTSSHVGKYWIGTYENGLGDEAIGTLTSAPFKVTHPWAAFLIAAGPYDTTRVELVNNADQKVIFKISGGDAEAFKVSNNSTETLAPVVVDLQAHQGKEIFIRILDQQAGGHWGHINFDDFKFYAQKPAFANALNPNQKSLAAVPADAPELPLDGMKFDQLSPEQTAKEMILPPGFKATLFAGEPDVKQPIAFCLDDRARVWVVENYTYPIRQPEGKGYDRILVFEDTNGDGKFDKRTVFMEGLNLASGIEYGFGGVWVGAAPYLYFIPVKESEDGPKPAGKPEVVLEGWSYQDTHEMLNTFTWGPDGWLYGCHGVFTHSHVKKPGEPDSARQFINAGVWRFHPTKRTFEVFAEGTSNPWGVDFDEHGQCFIEACVIPHLFHMIQGARYQRQGGEHYAPSLEEERRLAPQYFTQQFGGMTAQPENPYTYVDAKLKPINPFIYDDIKTIADHAHYTGNQWNNKDRASSSSIGGGHAHAGLMVYLGDSWPAEYRGKLFMNNIHGSRINMDVPVRAGSGFVGKHGADFINFNDRSSQILNLMADQDGSVFMIDWYDKQQCHDQRNPDVHDRSNGRIFKITYGNTKTTKVDLQKSSDDQLIGYLSNKNAWLARHAQRILQERTRFVAVIEGPDGKGGTKIKYVVEDERTKLNGDIPGQTISGIPATRRAIHESLVKTLRGTYTDPLHQLRTLWALHVTKGLDAQIGPMRGVALEQLKSKDEFVRAWTIQLLSESRHVSEAKQSEFLRLAKDDPSPVVRLYLASACQRLSVSDRTPIVEALLAHAEDVNDHNLPLMYWFAAEPIVGADTTKAVSLLAKTKIPIIREFITRRMTAGKLAQAEK